MTTEIEFLKDENKHLKACLEKDNWFQTEIIHYGGRLMDLQPGKTYCATQAWEAIKRKLDNDRK